MGYPTVTLHNEPPVNGPRVPFMGLEFDPYDMDGLVEDLVRHVDALCPLTYVVTPNVDHMVRLEAEPHLRPLYEAAGFNVCDSRILELMAAFEGKKLTATPGADLVERLLRENIKAEDRIVVIGAGVEAIDALSEKFGFDNIAWHDPPMGLRHNPDAVTRAAEFIIKNNEGFAFLCVGSPQQEMVAKRAIELGGGKGVMLCCGASLDFLSGKTNRAPKWMRESRLEWLHRLISEPKRLWKRYLIDGPRVFKIWMKHRDK